MYHRVIDWKNSIQNYPAAYFELFRTRKNDVLLESTREGRFGRFSYIALDPDLVFKAKGADIWTNGVHSKGNPLEVFQQVFNEKYFKRDFQKPEGAPLFYSGAVGYLGYDLKNAVESKLGTKAKDDTGFFDMHLLFPKTVVAFDHQERKIHITSKEHSSNVEKIENIVSRDAPTPDSNKSNLSNNKLTRTNLSFEQYKHIFDSAMDYVREGHTYQVKISMRHELDISEDSFKIYNRLRSINPSPYASYLDLEGICLVGCSPEELFRVEGRVAETRPIGGTYRKGKTGQEDEEIAKEFFRDQKELAEHIMLIDLERNDLGRVCKLGSVKVAERMALEKYSHLMHIVTTIRGNLEDKTNSFDVLRSMFPGGTVTGCPKIRTMEIIDELEPVARGPYTGSVGFFTPQDEAQFNIIIRTLAIDKNTNKGYIQVGGGIVEASNPEYEYEENLKKGRALVEAVLK